MNFLTVCYAERDFKKARELITTFLMASLALIGVLAVLGFVAAFTVPWASLLKLTTPVSSRNLEWAVCIAFVFTLLMVFCGIMDAVYGAFQNFAAVSIWDSASKVLATLAVVLITYTQMGLVGAIVAGIGAPALTKLIGVIDLFQFRIPAVRPNVAFYRSTYLRTLVTDGIQMLILTLSFAGIFQIDKMFLGFLIGAQAVTTFSIMAKIYLLALGMYALTFRSLWPAYTEAIHRGDILWVRKWLIISICAGLLIILAVGLILALFGKLIYQKWLGNSAFIPTSELSLAFAACFAMWVWVTAHASLLNAARILKSQILILGAHALLTVVTMPFFVFHWKVAGAAYAPFFAGIITSGWGYPWLVRKHVLHKKQLSPSSSVLFSKDF
jgi:O-antigen/teichoic acid export membrane protein